MKTADEQVLVDFRELPASQSCKLVEFEKAEVRPGFINQTVFLVIRGSAPCSNMRVQLMPLTYVQRPDYWEIEVVGCLQGPFCLPEIKPYSETLPLDGVLGTKGIEVVGRSRRVKIDVPGYPPVSSSPGK